jgi:hypothetical protein
LGDFSETTHSEDGSHCTLRKLTSFKPVADALVMESSGQPSGVSADFAKGTAAPDGSDGNDGSSEKEHPYVKQVNTNTAA